MNANTTNQDSLIINDFEIAAKVGTFPEERAFPQVLFISIEIGLPLEKAGKTDTLNHTLDYAALIDRLQKDIPKKEYNLIEAVAEKIAAMCLSYSQVQNVRVQVFKKIFSGIRKIGTSIYRQQ